MASCHKKTSIMKNRLIKKTIPLVFWASLWSIAAFFIGNDLILPGPWDIGRQMINLLLDGAYWSSFFTSFGKIILGLGLGLFLGLILGYLSYLSGGFRLLLDPFIGLIKTTPVAALTILLLVWISSDKLSLALIVMVLLPSVYQDILNGLDRLDPNLLEVSKVYRPSWKNSFKYLHWDQILLSLKENLTYSLGFAWKAGISGEILAQAYNSLGNRIYQAKIYLNIAELFAHILLLALAASLMEKVILSRWRKNGN